jgi:translation elongation factor EF-G
MRACDGVLLVVDAIEGVMLMTEKLIKHILR